LRVTVIGTPAPQGSKRHVGGGVMVESSKAVAPWRDAVAYAACLAANQAEPWVPEEGPVAVVVTFWLTRPKSAPKRRTLPDRKPDLDKLARSTLDALTTAGVIVDDARIVELTCRKLYATEGFPTGALIKIKQGPAVLTGRRDTE
jgi:crossover junction endodeoxyribonuclease RusA